MADHDQARVDLCERHAGHYDDDWWFLTYLGWSHTENGSVVKPGAVSPSGPSENGARTLTPCTLWRTRCSKTARPDDAEALIEGWLPIYHRSGLMYGHVAWHQALLALEQGDTGKASAIYFERIQPSVNQAPPLNAMTDGVSLLWRLQASGHPVTGDAWREIADYAEHRFPRAGNSFIDVHMAMLAAMTGNATALEQRLADLDIRRASGKLPAGSVVPDICRAARAFRSAGFSGLRRRYWSRLPPKWCASAAATRSAK